MKKPVEIQREHSKMLMDRSKGDNQATIISLVSLIKVLTEKKIKQ